MNIRGISHPVTPYKKWKHNEVVKLHPSMQRQAFLDSHQMRLQAQVEIHNNAERAISAWIAGL